MSFDKVKPCSLSAKMEDYDQFANHIALKVDEDVGIKRHKKLTGAEQVQPSIGRLLIGTDNLIKIFSFC